MGQLNRRDGAANVNVTLGPESDDPLAGKGFPCCVCSAILEIKFSKRGKTVLHLPLVRNSNILSRANSHSPFNGNSKFR